MNYPLFTFHFPLSTRASRGFTLVEMTLSLGIFTIVLFIATSAFFTIVNADRKARAVRIAADNLNLTLEDMSRRIKTGNTYNCGGGATGTNDCSGGSSSFAFNEKVGTRTTYKLESGSIFRNGTQVTSPEITITGLNFIVSGSAPLSSGGNTMQPMVVVAIDGSLGAGIKGSAFKIQTTVTQREYDNQ